MPPRRSSRLQAAAAPARDPFAALPLALALALFALLPVDQRLRCSEVCRGWRALLSDVSPWLRLDLSPAGGVARTAATNALLRAAAARAAGGLRALDVADCGLITHGMVCAVAAQNAGALAELRVGVAQARLSGALRPAELEQLLRAAPQLRVLEAVAKCDGLDAVVDAALQLQLPYLDLFESGLSPASVPSLARLLGGSALRTLVVEGESAPLLDEPAALLLSNALRVNTTLTAVTFKFINLFHEPANATALLGALTAHPSLRKLDISFNRTDSLAAHVVAAAGAPLGTLVAANAPALHELHMRHCWWLAVGDVVMGPLADALPHNTHLRVLDCSNNRMSEAFKRDRLLPAVRANAWLQATL
jgi:hypothetical protein